MGGDDSLDVLDRHHPASCRRVHLVEYLAGEVDVDATTRERMRGDDADQGSLERAHVGRDAVGDQAEHRFVLEMDVIERCSLAQDRESSPAIRRAYVDHQPGLEALSQTLLEVDELAGQPVAGDHELASGLLEGVESVEELLFGLGLAGEELDVIDEEHVGVAVGALEVVQRSRAECVDELIGERLDGRIADRCLLYTSPSPRD